jgi:hypothetical protein
MPTFTNAPVQSQTDTTSPAMIAENTNATENAGVGIHAKSAAAGMLGESSTWHGVAGITQSTTGGAGVTGPAVALRGGVWLTPPWCTGVLSVGRGALRHA